MEGIHEETDFVSIVIGSIGMIIGLVCSSIYVSHKRKIGHFSDGDALIVTIIGMMIGFTIIYVIFILISIMLFVAVVVKLFYDALVASQFVIGHSFTIQQL